MSIEPTRSRWRINRATTTERLRNLPRSPARSPAGNTVLFVWVAVVAAVLVGLIVTFVHTPITTALIVIVILFATVYPRQWVKNRYIADVFQRTRKITRDEEYEADIAQDRRRYPALLRGDWRVLAFRTHFENVRKSVRPSKYVRVEFGRAGFNEVFVSPMRVWMPQREDITQIVRRWSPLFEPYHQGGLDRLQKQVEAFYGGAVTMTPDTRACVAVFEPVRDRLEDEPLVEELSEGR